MYEKLEVYISKLSYIPPKGVSGRMQDTPSSISAPIPCHFPPPVGVPFSRCAVQSPTTCPSASFRVAYCLWQTKPYIHYFSFRQSYCNFWYRKNTGKVLLPDYQKESDTICINIHVAPKQTHSIHLEQ